MSENVAIVAIVRWESDHLAEWLDYHYRYGISRFYLYINDDFEDDVCEAVRQSSVPFRNVTLYHVTTIGLQRQSYCHFLATHRAECDWFIFLDADEFIAIQREMRIPEFLDSLAADVGSYCLYWVLFGPNGAIERTKGSVLQSYTKRSRFPNWHCKNFTRSEAISTLPLEGLKDFSFWHCWGNRLPKRYRSIDGVGNDMSSYWLNFPDWIAARVTRPEIAAEIFSKEFVAHYFMKSIDAASYRMRRGIKRDFSSQALWGQFQQEGKIGRMILDASQIEDRRLAEASRQIGVSRKQSRVRRPRVSPFYTGQKFRRMKITDATQIGDVTGPLKTVEFDPCLHGDVQARVQLAPQGDRPYWSASLSVPVSLFGVAVFLAPNEQVNGTLLLIVSTIENSTPIVVKVDRLATATFRSLVPFLWQNTNRHTITRIQILLENQGVIPLDHVALLCDPVS